MISDKKRHIDIVLDNFALFFILFHFTTKYLGILGVWYGG